VLQGTLQLRKHPVFMNSNSNKQVYILPNTYNAKFPRPPIMLKQHECIFLDNNMYCT
jgi:phosphatidate phosphatase APP1